MNSSLRQRGRAVLRAVPLPIRRRLFRVSLAVLDRPDPQVVLLKRRLANAVKQAKAVPPKPAPPKPMPPAGTDPAFHLHNPTMAERLEQRRKHAFGVAAPDSRILEIGAAHNGIFRKRDGFDTRITDYLDRAGLVEKYRDQPQYSPDDIEEVDYILDPGKSLTDVIPDRFGIVLASHVIEHTTSLVHFLNDCAELLDEGGTLVLVVPDHRYCFDRLRERTSLARVVDAYYTHPPVHTTGTLAEFYLNEGVHRGTPSWFAGHNGTYWFARSEDAALEEWRQGVDADGYVDVHNWVFSPNHMRLLLDDLYRLGLIRLREAYFHPTVGHEFYLSLRVDGPGSGLTRDRLVELADAERTGLDKAILRDPEVVAREAAEAKAKADAEAAVKAAAAEAAEAATAGGSATTTLEPPAPTH